MVKTLNLDERRGPRVLDDARDMRPDLALAADEVWALARHRDPSRHKPSAETSTQRPRIGVVWVRPSELLPGAGGRVLGRGIALQAELTRRTRALPVQAVATSRRAIRERALRLPPVSGFGHRGRCRPVPARAGVGLG